MPSDWTGKTVLITGASRGIGKACAVLFAEQGANLILASRSKADLETTATSIAKEGQKILVVPTDVTEPSQVKHLFQKIGEEFGGLDVLVNNAVAHYKLGNAYGKSGQYQEAIASFKEAIRINLNQKLGKTFDIDRRH